MIINPEKMGDYYICNKAVMEYLIYEELLPILGYKKDYYFFYKDKKLEEALKRMPLHLKISNALSRKKIKKEL